MTEKVSRKELTDMKMGETRTFQLQDARQCDAGKSIAYQLQNILRCKFSARTDYLNNRLTITKSEMRHAD